MKIINAVVNNVDVSLETIETIIENQVNNAKVIIKFDETWEPFDKYVIFKDESLNTYKVAVINDEVMLPNELKSGFVDFQIYGQVLGDSTIEKRQPTRICGLLVENSLSPDGLNVSIPTPSEWDNYIKQIEDITNRIVSDEATRVENENNRVSNEDTRIKNEKARVSSETTRVNAETNRAKSETTRVENEKSRVSAENKRLLAENQRIEVENTRVDNEKQRVSSETVRIKNEETREEYILQLKKDVKDGKFNGEANLAVFKVEVKTGKLLMLKTKNLRLIDFRINEKGRLEELLKWITQ
jgi:hypothetical protein